MGCSLLFGGGVVVLFKDKIKYSGGERDVNLGLLGLHPRQQCLKDALL